MGGEERVHVTVKVQGVVLPTWAAILLALSLLFSALGFLLYAIKLSAVEREIRILQLHVQDLESVIIRSGIATRDELADWQPSKGPRTRPPSRETDPAEPEEEK